MVVLMITLLFVGTKVDILGYEAKVVQSGSMEPAISTGDLVVIAPSASYQVGDIVTYGRDQRGQLPVTHRIVEITESKGRALYATKGDANEDRDPRKFTDHSIIGKVAFSIPKFGYAIEFARTPLGFVLLIGIPALVVVLDELANIAFEFHKYRFRRKREGKVGYRTPARERQPRDLNKDLKVTKPNQVHHLYI